MNAMASVREALMAGSVDPGPGPTEQTAFVVHDRLACGQAFRLPSGRVAEVVGVGIMNVQLQYRDAVTLRRDALARLGRRVLGTGGSTGARPNPPTHCCPSK
jgi:hypothetical protein